MIIYDVIFLTVANEFDWVSLEFAWIMNEDTSDTRIVERRSC